MIGNDKDCICHKPEDKHTKRCDAYRLSEMYKKCASIIFRGGSLKTQGKSKEYNNVIDE